MTIKVDSQYVRTITLPGEVSASYDHWHMDRFVITQDSTTTPKLVVEFWGHFYIPDGNGGKVHDQEMKTHNKVLDAQAFAQEQVAQGNTKVAAALVALQEAMAETMNSQLPQYNNTFEVL